MERHMLNPEAPEFSPGKQQKEEREPQRPGRRAKVIARD